MSKPLITISINNSIKEAIDTMQAKNIRRLLIVDKEKMSIGTGVVLITGGYIIYGKPESAGKWGVAILVASIVSLFSMGGFFIGPILGIIGGILALTKK